MKKILLVVVFWATFGSLFAQQTNVVPDDKLYSRFQTEDINNMLNQAPQEIKYWNWFVENGFVIKEETPEYASKYEPLRFFDKDTKLAGEEEVAYTESVFNIMQYDFEILQDKTNTYRIGNTGYIVNVLSASNLVKNYNKYLKNEQ